LLEFPGCHAEGDTPAEAITNLEKAASAWIEASVEQEQEIPSPVNARGFSGKINLRLPKWIHKQAARLAERDNISLNQFFIGAIAARVGAEGFYDHLVQRLESRTKPTQPAVIIQAVTFVSTCLDRPKGTGGWFSMTDQVIPSPCRTTPKVKVLRTADRIAGETQEVVTNG
jgi:predicted HicB family RNase H-like nuclease